MVADTENGKNFLGRPRRSSFVAASEENADFVPILPAVGSIPIPAASEVNYFPTVATGQPSLREPEPPSRLVVPMRKSMSEEEIANLFVDSAEMTSSEQFLMLDAQVLLREDDLRTAKEFVSQLRLVKPEDAQLLLDELKAVFADVDPEIALLSLTGDSGSEPSENSDDVPTVKPATPSISDSTSALANLLDSPPPAGSVLGASQGSSANGRHRGWNVILFVSTMVAILIPVSSAVFSGFGSPVPVDNELMLSAAGVLATVVALLAALPLILLARSTAIRHALSTRSALHRVTGAGGGTVLWSIGALGVLVGLLTVLLLTSQGVGLQLSSIPGVASTLAQLVPNAHASVLVVALVVFTGFLTASMPRQTYRGAILALAGFTLSGPTIVILTGLAVVATTNTGLPFTPENTLIATGIVPIAVILFAGIESGAATVVRRDDKPALGLPLYVGLALGLGFAAWVLVAGMSPEALGDLMIGSNPALHIVAASAELALVSGIVAFTMPLILIAALVGRSLMMVTVRGDRDASPAFVRAIIVAVPLIVLIIDLTGAVGDITMTLPGISFVSIPLMVIVGLMAGASVAAGREIGGPARVINTVLAIIVMAVGFVLTSWSVPSLANLYDDLIAPLLSTAGISGTIMLVIPTVVLVCSFILSLIVSALGVVRPKRTA